MRWEILRPLAEERRREVLQRAVRRRYRNGDSVFHQADPGDSIHLLDRGHVAIRVVNRRGDGLTLDLIGPGQSFGEQTLLRTGSRRTASAVAIGNVETLMLQGDAFRDLQRAHPEVSLVLVELLAAQVRRLSDQLLDAHTMPADERVLKQLRRLADAFCVDGAATIPLTQEDLASLAGTTRPTANRALQSVVDEGLVELRRGRIVVADVRRLPSA
ncbi:MAG TPA: Crp/Fnr family transcriptional regulator [Ilumatobacteraceae bacterium]